MPAGPPPTMPTFSGRRTAGGSTGGSSPCSAAKRLSVRIAIGSSRTPLRHTVSHGAVQIQPQTDGNGLTSAATAYASSYRFAPMSPMYRPASVPAGQAAWQGACATTGPDAFIERQTCQASVRSAVSHDSRPPHGDGWSRLRTSRVTDARGSHVSGPAAGTVGRSIGPWRGASFVSPGSATRVMTTTGHSPMQMPQPMHSPTWTGCSIIHGCGRPWPAVSIPGPVGRDMSSASTGHVSMQMPQLMQPVRSMSMR